MIETNIRIVKPGANLYLWTRYAKITTQDPSAEMLEKVCNQFASQQGLGAVYCPERKQILVLTQGIIAPLTVSEENWIVEAKDSGKNQRLQFLHSENDARLLAQLIERHVLIEIKRRLSLRTINSPRILYKSEPFQSAAGIDAYRRFEISAIPIENVGVGISVDIGVAFFTQWTVADFFRNDLSKREQEYRQKRFESLSERQSGQKGTLRYDSGKNLSNCYFDKFSFGITCATTGKRIVKGDIYGSLLEYYRQRQPHLKIGADDCVAMVSFKGIDQPQPVAAKLLHLRVMNDSLPRTLKHVDKLVPEDRARLISCFWKDARSNLLGRGKPPVAQHFWCPEEKRIINLLPPTLQFADGVALPAPQERNYAAFQEHYRQRLQLLHKVGCLDVPILMERVVHFAIPAETTQEMQGSLIRDITGHLSRLTKKTITPKLVPYKTLDEAFMELKRHNKPGMVVFVFDDEAPETYYKVAYELSNWRIKRITLRESKNKFDRLKPINNHRSGQLSKAERDWNSFIEMSTLDVLQQMDCVPWGFKDELPYDAHLAIDVGRDKRHFALSLLIFHPFPRIYTIVKPKTDAKKETINGTILSEKVVELFKKVIQRNDFQPLRSLLVLRDGRKSGNELEAIEAAKEELITNRILVAEAAVDIVDFHKRSAKKPRLWEKAQENKVQQIFEGKGFFSDKYTVVFATTGDPTLRQGTASPVMLVGRSKSIDMDRVTKAVYASTHLNFSNPKVAQRLPLELKRTDDELKSRDSQEIRRIQ